MVKHDAYFADDYHAVVRGIVATYGGKEYIPKLWQERCEPLPQWLFKDGK